MTLVMTAGIGSAFTVMTSDERTAFKFSEEFIIPDPDVKLLKNYQLTDTVLFGWGGNRELADQIRERLTKVARPSDSLEECIEYLEEIEATTDLDEGVAVILSGFYADGSSGKVMLRTGAKVNEWKVPSLGYRYALLPPAGLSSARERELMHIESFLPSVILEEFPSLGYGAWLKKSIDIAVNHLIHLHGVISFEQPRSVTPEGFYYVTYRDAEGNVQTTSAAYDSSPVHEQLKKQLGAGLI